MIDEKSERKAFQDWFEADAMPLEHSNWFKKDADGDYEFDFVADAWRGWKARAEECSREGDVQPDAQHGKSHGDANRRYASGHPVDGACVAAGETALHPVAQQAPFPNESLEDDIETSVRAILNFCSEDHSLERRTGYVRERIMRHVQRAPAAQSELFEAAKGLLAEIELHPGGYDYRPYYVFRSRSQLNDPDMAVNRLKKAVGESTHNTTLQKT